MLTIKTYLAASGATAQIEKDFPLYQGIYQNVLLNIFVPSSLLPPNFSSVSATDQSKFYTEFVAGVGVSVAMRSVARNGRYQESEKKYCRYVKMVTKNGVSYALFERLMPQAFTMFEGQGVNAPTQIINVEQVQFGQIDSDETVCTLTNGGTEIDVTSKVNAASVASRFQAKTFTYDFEYADGEWQYDGEATTVSFVNLSDYTIANGDTLSLELTASNPTIVRITTSQTAKFDVLPSSRLSNDDVLDATAQAEIQAQLQTHTAEISALSASVVDLNNDVSDLDERLDDAESDIDDLETTVGQHTTQIQSLQQQIATGDNYIGTYTSANVDDEHVTQFVVETAERQPQSGDVVIAVKQISGATDKIYKYRYGASSWSHYEIPALEEAGYNSLGIIKGEDNGNTQKVKATIQNGKILDLKYGASYDKSAGDSLGVLGTYIAGTAKVPKSVIADKAIADEDGNNIKSTYATKAGTPTKQWVRNYALPREFNEPFYLAIENETDDVLTKTPPTADVKEINIVNVGAYTEIFNGAYTFANDSEILFTLTGKNSVSTMLTLEGIGHPIKFLVEMWANHDGTQTKICNYVSGYYNVPATETNVRIDADFNLLGNDIVTVDSGDTIRQKISVWAENTGTVTLYFAEDWSKTYLYTGSAVIKVAGGALGEITRAVKTNVSAEYDAEQEITTVIVTFGSIDNVGDNTIVEFIIDQNLDDYFTDDLKFSILGERYSIRGMNGIEYSFSNMEQFAIKSGGDITGYRIFGVVNASGNFIETIVPNLDEYYIKSEVDAKIDDAVGDEVVVGYAINSVSGGVANAVFDSMGAGFTLENGKNYLFSIHANSTVAAQMTDTTQITVQAGIITNIKAVINGVFNRSATTNATRAQLAQVEHSDANGVTWEFRVHFNQYQEGGNTYRVAYTTDIVNAAAAQSTDVIPASQWASYAGNADTVYLYE